MTDAALVEAVLSLVPRSETPCDEALALGDLAGVLGVTPRAVARACRASEVIAVDGEEVRLVDKTLVACEMARDDGSTVVLAFVGAQAQAECRRVERTFRRDDTNNARRSARKEMTP